MIGIAEGRRPLDEAAWTNDIHAVPGENARIDHMLGMLQQRIAFAPKP